mgnify:FL=1
MAILCLLTGRAASVSTRNVLLLLGLGLHLVVVVLLRTAAALENHATHDNIVNIAHIPFILYKLMMEEANVSKRHGDAVLIACIDNIIVTDATACFCYVFNTTLVSTLNVVAEWEESIAT